MLPEYHSEKNEEFRQREIVVNPLTLLSKAFVVHAFPILHGEVPQATVPSGDTHMLQCVVIHRLQSGYQLTMVSPWAAGESLLPHLEHLLPSFFPPLGEPCCFFLFSPPLSVVFSHHSSIPFSQGTSTLVARLSSALPWVGWSWELSVWVTPERNMSHGKATLERGKSMKRSNTGDDLCSASLCTAWGGRKWYSSMK